MSHNVILDDTKTCRKLRVTDRRHQKRRKRKLASQNSGFVLASTIANRKRLMLSFIIAAKPVYTTKLEKETY